MTGRINYTPEAEQQFNQLDDWITEAASAEIAQQFVSAILDHIDGILVFPLAGRARDDVRPGMRTTTVKKQTLSTTRLMNRPMSSWSTSSASSTVARTGRPCSAEIKAIRRRADDLFVRGNAWQESQPSPLATNACQRVLCRSAAQCQ